MQILTANSHLIIVDYLSYPDQELTFYQNPNVDKRNVVYLFQDHTFKTKFRRDSPYKHCENQRYKGIYKDTDYVIHDESNDMWSTDHSDLMEGIEEILNSISPSSQKKIWSYKPYDSEPE